jgi:hypothetical protein
MGRAKEIIVKVIPAKIANEFVKKHHYSGKVVSNSSLHFGCFLDDKLHGVMSYGSPMDKSKVLPMVQPSLWNEMLELNRMAFDEYLPKNSESRCISISIKLIKKNAPHIKWILSFSDGTQCGDGTIYRASGFVLTNIGKNKTIVEFPNGVRIADLTWDSATIERRKEIAKKCNIENPILNKFFSENIKIGGGKRVEGYQMRYIYLIDKTCKITVPILPFSKIDEMGAGMYKGEKISLEERKNKDIEKID